MRLIGALLFRILVALFPGVWLRWLLTKLLPFRLITGRSDNDPYLYRWTLRKRSDGGRVYLHYFARSDDDAALHSHPWTGHSTILAWGYREERRMPMVRHGDGARAYSATGRVGWVWLDSVKPGTFERGKRLGHIVLARSFRFLDENSLEADTFHRVDLLRPDKGCWTLFEVGPYEKSWGFWDRNTGEVLPHKEFIAKRKSL